MHSFTLHLLTKHPIFVALRDCAAIDISTASNGFEASMCSLATSAAKSGSLQGSLSGIDPVLM